jgi:hypothetical protein
MASRLDLPVRQAVCHPLTLLSQMVRRSPSQWIEISIAVDAAGYAPALKSIMRRRKHNVRRHRRMFAPIHASVQSSGNSVIVC